MKLTIYGASDDLIEIEGDLRDEFGYYSDDPAEIKFSDGTVATIAYGDEVKALWSINVHERGTASFVLTKATNEKTDYSDRLTVEGVEWVEINGRRFPDRRKARRQRRAEDRS